MPRFLVCSALFATSGIPGAQVGLHRLAGPSACTPLNEGVSTSVLIKIDNVNDDTYTAVVYDTEDCTGSIVGSVSNLNGYLDLYAFQNTAGKAVQVIPVSGRRDTPNQGFVTDHQYNLANNETAMKVPIMHGSFHTIQKSNRTEDGNYLYESVDVFEPMTLAQLRHIDKIWAFPRKAIASDSIDETSLHFLNERQFEWAYCDWHAICLRAVDLGIQISNSGWADSIARIVGSRPWRYFWRGVDFQTSGTQNTQCDTKKTTGGLIQDLVNSASQEGMTNASFMVEDENGKQFVWKLYDDS